MYFDSVVGPRVKFVSSGSAETLDTSNGHSWFLGALIISGPEMAFSRRLLELGLSQRIGLIPVAVSKSFGREAAISLMYPLNFTLFP